MRFAVGQTVLQASSKPALPPLRRQARNMAAAVLRNGRSVLAGHPLKADDPEIVRRRSSCEGGDGRPPCPFYRADLARCAHPQCGCNKRAKTFLYAERCPDGRW